MQILLMYSILYVEEIYFSHLSEFYFLSNTTNHSLKSLDYSNALCMGLPLKTVWKFQIVENAAASFLINVSQYAFVLTHLH